VLAALAAGETAQKPEQTCSTTGFCTVDTPQSQKPILIGLTQDSALPPCRFTLLESARVKEKYRIQCAQKCGYDVDIASCEAVVLHDLTNESLAKIASGICDTPYTKLVSQALLLGKTVYLMQDQIELYNYRQTAAKTYYKMFRSQLGMLEESGLQICCPDKIEDILVNGVSQGTTCTDAEKTNNPSATETDAEPKAVEQTVKLEQHLISERTVAEACQAGVSRISVGANAIVTDLAREYAQNHQVVLVRE
jgi:ethanolamine utilization protein